MFQLSETSKTKLLQCDTHLQEICHTVSAFFNFTVLEGHRSKERQEQLFAEGKTKVHYPAGKHNHMPSLAIDIAPYPVDWQDRARFFMLAGMMLAVAHARGIRLRWGGDWDGDGDTQDQRFDDLVHFEILK